MTAATSDKAEISAFQRYRRLLPHVWPARWQIVVGLLAGAAYGVLSGAGLPVMLKTVLPIFFGKENEAPARVVALARALFGDDYQNSLLLLSCFGLPLIFLLRGICSYINRYLINRAGFVFLDNLRQEVFERFQELPLAFFQQHKSGDLVSRLVNDANQLKSLVTNLSSDIVKQPLVLVASLGYLVYLSVVERSALFTLVALVSVPLCVVPIWMVTRRLIKRSRIVARQSGELASVVTEALQSPLEIQAYNLQAAQRERFAAKVKEIFRHAMKTVKYQAMMAPVIEFISACGFMVALYFGVRNGMSFATFSAMGLALFMAYEPVKKLSGLHGMIRARMASLERLEQILDAPDTVPAPPSPRPLPASPGAVVFENVSFNYPNTEAGTLPALDGVNVTLRPGETIALVGKSGAGKTTFALLIPRFFDPTAGRITFSGVDLREVDKSELRGRIAIVPQMPVLFHGTIAENIRVGRQDATDAEVREAAQRAYVTEFAESLPQGCDTVVGERGASLSGGQRQRIAIARAFLKNAPILILDEATSALDSNSEAMVRDALRELVRDRTTLIIAHRFSTISFAGRILFFEEGRITGDGSPATLTQTHAAYQHMSGLQRLP